MISPPTLFTATIYGKVPDLAFNTKLFYELQPVGDIVSIVCDHGKKFQVGHEPKAKKHHHAPTVSGKFNSFGSCLIFKVITDKPYNIMLFINGVIQVAGVLQLDFSDALAPINTVLSYLSTVTHTDYTFTAIRAELMNFKCILDSRISLEELKAPSHLGDHLVTYSDYNIDRHTAFIIKGVGFTIKLFESGKINLLGIKNTTILPALIVNLNSYLSQQKGILYT